ncbi:MAG: MlaD family protein [Phycisphaerales bacterium]
MTEVPTARLVRRPRFNPTWLAPIIVLVVVAAVAWQGYSQRGPTIAIRFDDAAGLREGDAIVYRGVEVGDVTRIALDPHTASVLVTAELHADAAHLAVQGAEFWIVRPEVSLERIAGLETLVGPHYIQLRPGPAGASPAREFVARADPPAAVIQIPEGARRLILRAPRLGPIALGTPVTYRDVPIGRVYGTALAPDADAVIIFAAVNPRYAPLVRERTRFWNASGIQADFGLFAGISLRADSLQSVLTGAIAMATPERTGAEIDDGHVFELESEAPESWVKWQPPIPLAGGVKP